MKNPILISLLLVSYSCIAQDLTMYVKKELRISDSQTLPYRILFPENYDRSKKYPVVLFLHGAGERGNDNEKQLTHGAQLFLTEEARKKFQSIVIFPQCKTEGFWSNVKVDRTKTPLTFDFDYKQPATDQLDGVIKLLKKVIKEEAVDKRRIYITGLSMGGMGTFEMVYRKPKLFAAALPICGGGDTNHYNKKVKAIPFWVFHGAVDAVVNVKYSQEMVTKLKLLGVDVRYSEYPNVNHNSWDNAFAEPDYLSWMFSNKRK
ncbi:MAG TPA: prolyl oligopeptidase family serine peptidase [Cyclobacteriaceae bacterium]|jgi:predicted peptidase|nr:prolyl oligopeptidase family serine peptidase [Cyclobacteriaceae bacterium]